VRGRIWQCAGPRRRGPGRAVGPAREAGTSGQVREARASRQLASGEARSGAQRRVGMRQASTAVGAGRGARRRSGGSSALAQEPEARG
jgi:hypothetical protein